MNPVLHNSLIAKSYTDSSGYKPAQKQVDEFFEKVNNILN